MITNPEGVEIDAIMNGAAPLSIPSSADLSSFLHAQLYARRRWLALLLGLVGSLVLAIVAIATATVFSCSIVVLIAPGTAYAVFMTFGYFSLCASAAAEVCVSLLSQPYSPSWLLTAQTFAILSVVLPGLALLCALMLPKARQSRQWFLVLCGYMLVAIACNVISLSIMASNIMSTDDLSGLPQVQSSCNPQLSYSGVLQVGASVLEAIIAVEIVIYRQRGISFYQVQLFM